MKPVLALIEEVKVLLSSSMCTISVLMQQYHAFTALSLLSSLGQSAAAAEDGGDGEGGERTREQGEVPASGGLRAPRLRLLHVLQVQGTLSAQLSVGAHAPGGSTATHLWDCMTLRRSRTLVARSPATRELSRTVRAPIPTSPTRPFSLNDRLQIRSEDAAMRVLLGHGHRELQDSRQGVHRVQVPLLLQPRDLLLRRQGPFLHPVPRQGRPVRRVQSGNSPLYIFSFFFCTEINYVQWRTLKVAYQCAGPGKCPLGGTHKPNGEECSLGCAMVSFSLSGYMIANIANSAELNKLDSN